MGFQKNTDPQYELLRENQPCHPTILQNRVNTIWVLFCVVGLLLSLITATVYLTSTNYLETFTSAKFNKLDFVMIGPEKVVKADYKIVKHRAEQYALSSYIGNSTKWISDAAEKTLKLDQKFKYVSKKYKLVCYYILPKNVTTGQLLPDDIDPGLCTHINLAFAFVSNETIQSTSNADSAVYNQVLALKKKNPSLKVLVSIFCNDQYGLDLQNVIENKPSRKRFISNVIAFLDSHNLDGIDFDWEFPSWPDKNENQKIKFMHFLEDLHSAFNKFKLSRQIDGFILSVAVAAPGLIIDQAYNISLMARAVDYINLMAYDYHFFTDYLPVTGPNAALFQSVKDANYFATLNGNWSVHKWLEAGMPADKIILGVPTYAHTFQLINPDNHVFNSPANGFGNSVGYDGAASYAEVCRFLSDPETKVKFDHNTRTPYAYKKTDWISFDDEQSLGYKAEYVTEEGLGGVMVWALNLDDYDGLCENSVFNEDSTFPLINRIKKTLNDDNL